MKSKLITVLLILSLAPWAGAGEKTVTLATMDWPPYTGYELKAKGYAAEIVQRAFEKAGYTVTIKFFPWSDALEVSQAGEVDGIFPMYHEPEREQYYLFSKPFAKSPVGLFKRSSLPAKTPLGQHKRSEPIRFEVDPRVDMAAALKSLKGYTVGVVKGYANPPPFEQIDFSTYTTYSDRENMESLIQRQVDLALMDKRVGNYLLRHYFPWKKNDVTFMKPPLEYRDLHLALSKNSQNPSEKMEKFDLSLKLLEKDGVLDDIRRFHLQTP